MSFYDMDIKLTQVLSWMQSTIESNIKGEIWECGIHHGATARWIGFHLSMTPGPRVYRLFDTFCGRTETSPQDGQCNPMRFDNTSVEAVARRVPWPFAKFHVGPVPKTFAGLEESRIAFAYVDLDLYQPTKDALDFIVPRLAHNGIILVDDFTAVNVWPGVQVAVHEIAQKYDHLFFSLAEAQACLFKNPYEEKA